MFESVIQFTSDLSKKRKCGTATFPSFSAVVAHLSVWRIKPGLCCLSKLIRQMRWSDLLQLKLWLSCELAGKHLRKTNSSNIDTQLDIGERNDNNFSPSNDDRSHKLQYLFQRSFTHPEGGVGKSQSFSPGGLGNNLYSASQSHSGPQKKLFFSKEKCRDALQLVPSPCT